MAITWILVAHGSAGKILDVRKNGEEIAVLKEFSHPKTAKKDIDRDPEGSGKSSKNPGPLRHAIDYSGESEDHEREVFAQEMADFLAKALSENRFNKLILVASRSLLGDLRKAISSPVKKMVAHELDKDLISQRLSESELCEKIRDDLDLVSL